ncbi:MAG: hypothetical protein ACYCYO_01640 [Bacilli bacterium]
MDHTGNRKVTEKIRFLCDADKRTKFAGARLNAAMCTMGEVQRWTANATKMDRFERRRQDG